MKLMRLRYAGTCAACSSELPAKTQAWWDGAAKQVTCVACRPVDAEPAAIEEVVVVVPSEPVEVIAPASVEAEPLEAPDLDRGIPGGSAREERRRRSQRREDVVRSKHPKIGGFLLAAFDDPTSTKVWDQGAIGEERVGAWLESARPKGIEVLHDRAIPRSRANIDHLVIAPNGIWVVDAKRYLDGKLERRDVGGFFKTDVRLFVGGRDKSALIEGVRKQVSIVETFLESTEFASVPVHGALCFVDIQKGWFTKPFSIGGVSVTWRKHLVEPMLAPESADSEARAALTAALAAHFRAK